MITCQVEGCNFRCVKKGMSLHLRKRHNLIRADIKKNPCLATLEYCFEKVKWLVQNAIYLFVSLLILWAVSFLIHYTFSDTGFYIHQSIAKYASRVVVYLTKANAKGNSDFVQEDATTYRKVSDKFYDVV